MKTLSTESTSITSGHLVDEGLVARASGVASVRQLIDPGPAGAGRVVDVRVMGGIDLEVRPDRGLDIGAAWYRGVPLSWTSPVANGAPLDRPRGGDWVDRFVGGLVTTCGTDNIGPPTPTAGMHGRHSHLPATDVRTDVRRDGDGFVCEVAATVEDVSMFRRRIVVRRSITTRTDDPVVVLRDVIENQGYEATPLPLLYHLNLGAPLVHPGSRVRTASTRVVAREPVGHVPDASLVPQPLDAPTEAVFEHVGPEVVDGVGRAVVTSPVWGTAAVVTWSAATLPRLYQWVWPARRGWALALEPSNAALFGPDRDDPERAAPLVPAGGVLTTELTVRLVPLADLDLDGEDAG
jgi:hypothetical protein